MKNPRENHHKALKIAPSKSLSGALVQPKSHIALKKVGLQSHYQTTAASDHFIFVPRRFDESIIFQYVKPC